MSNNSTAILTKAAERLRQQQETFNQRKKQDSFWFVLKLIMGYTAILLLMAILIISGYIILNHLDFPEKIINWAAPAFFVDILGLIFTVWKVVLSPSHSTKLEPEIK
jgi:ABC-type transport system involved in cytochrome bd biosynthesis fused ATPase/permease subunit|tara:strand:+ start:308 stop:628 length:321 start_codon:yes stop_codon:yes gene_type:complete